MRTISKAQDSLRLVADGLLFGESPRWRDGALWVSDWGANEVLRIDDAGQREVMARVQSFPMCIEHLPDGRLLIVDSARKRLLRREPDGSLAQHADFDAFSELDAFGNDIVVDGRGAIYVNDIGFKFPGGEFRPGVIVLVAPDGAVRKVADDLAFPNGMAVTPENKTLIVAESYACRLTAFDISPDGSLSDRHEWAQVDDHPDGICLDAAGCAWYADVGNKRCVRVREGGEVLETVELDRGAFAYILGGPERRTLFIVCQDWRGAGNWTSGPAPVKSWPSPRRLPQPVGRDPRRYRRTYTRAFIGGRLGGLLLSPRRAWQSAAASRPPWRRLSPPTRYSIASASWPRSTATS